MPEPKLDQVVVTEMADPRWKDLYRIGAVSCILLAASIVIAIIVYLIWPYTPGFTSVTNIFVLLQNNRLEGLMSLEFSALIVLPISILQILAVYVALKRVNESYALIALILGLMGSTLFFTARPLVEMVYLSDQYAISTSDMTKSQYLAAGEAFTALFGGTAWMWANILGPISGIISSVLMLRSNIFSKATAYLGIVSCISSIGIIIPGIGAIFGLLGTISGVPWYVLMARTFFQLGWGKSNAIQG